MEWFCAITHSRCILQLRLKLEVVRSLLLLLCPKPLACHLGLLYNSQCRYRKVMSSSPSHIEAHAGLFILLMKGIFDHYVLWPFDKKLIFKLVTCVSTHDFTICKMAKVPEPRIEHKNRTWATLVKGQPLTLETCWPWLIFFTHNESWLTENGEGTSARTFSWVHCCIKCAQIIQVKTLLQPYTAFTCRFHNKILWRSDWPLNKGNLLLRLWEMLPFKKHFL